MIYRTWHKVEIRKREVNNVGVMVHIFVAVKRMDK